ncbi:MAG: hypothetical protein DME98_00360 [Verrucomicrobia bacterium]|nr:MAG: hypothetical protein DME98_00360 [Verrucomicrobiota bacterium]
MKTCTCIISEERAPRKRGAYASKRPPDPPTLPSSTVTCYTDITDGKETGVAELHPLLSSLPAPTEFTIPAVIGDYLPLEVKLNM